MIIKLSEYIALEISSDLYFRDIDVEPKLHIYDLGENYKHFHINESDSGENSREFTYSAPLNNAIINSTSGSYLEDLLGLGYESTSIENILENDLISKLQFRKCRLLFVSGFGYEPINNIAGLSYRGYIMTSNGTVDLFSLFDTYDNSRILPSIPTLHENVLYNAAIEFYMLDIDSLYAANTPDLSELRTLLFGDTHPQVIYFDHSLFTLNEVRTFAYNSKNWNKIAFSQIFKQNQSMIQSDSDFFVAIDLNNKAVEFKLSHTERNAGAYITNVATQGYEESIKVSYQITSSLYNISGSLIGLDTIEMNRVSDKFNTIRLIPDVTQATADHMLVQITAIVTASNGFRLVRSSQINITDLEPYKTQTLNLTLTEDIVYNKQEITINKVEPESTVPDVIQMIKPVYIKSYPTENISLLPYNQTIKIETDTDVSNLKTTKLVIGSLIYFSIGDPLTFTIDSKAYYDSSKNYYLTTDNNEVIVYGEIERIKS